MATGARKPSEGTVLEIQIHPSDIRRRVWYFFLRQRQINWAIAIAAGAAIFRALSVFRAPAVLGNLLSRNKYHALV